MLRRLTVPGLLIMAAVAMGGYLLASGQSIQPMVPLLTTVQVVEFYHSGLDQYFITADPVEIAVLDAGRLSGWARTGYTFLAYSSDSSGSGLSPVCRLYGLPAPGLDSHFYSGSPSECAAVLTQFAASWTLESSDVFQMQMPDAGTGMCADDTVPVYRLWNNRVDSNHRYTTDPGVRLEMIANGYISEGYGPSGVAFCAPTSPSASISVIGLALDTFDFNAIATPSNGAQIVAYAWDFGDGGSATGATPSHQFTLSGSYPVVLTVTDSSNVAAKATKTVTAATSDFEARKSAPGVIRWFDFDTTTQLGTVNKQANFGILSGTSATPVIDTTVKASGTGSLRIDVPSQSGQNAGGTWYANFSPDLLTQFGDNSEFFIQWRQRFNQAFVDTFFQQSGGTPAAIKQAIITTGDQPGKVYNSCEATEVVVTSYSMHRFPTAYNSCAGSGSTTHAPYSGFYEPVGSGEFLLENAVPSPGCTYTQARAAAPTAAPPGCFGWVANEWMTFQVGITLGPRDNTTNDFSNSRFRLWAAREGQPSQLLIDWQPGIRGYFPLAAGPAAQNQQFGKIWLLPYMTSKDPTQVHPLAQTWYDELIISRQQIPDPGASTTTPGSSTGSANASSASSVK
jgi:PKD repeat protein